CKHIPGCWTRISAVAGAATRVTTVRYWLADATRPDTVSVAPPSHPPRHFHAPVPPAARPGRAHVRPARRGRREGEGVDPRHPGVGLPGRRGGQEGRRPGHPAH